MSVAERNLQVVQGGAMPTLNVSNDQKLVAIRETVAKGATDAEFTMLMHLANTYQLDPFLKEIWFIKYGGTPTIMVSRDGLRNYAQKQEDFEGLLSQEVRKGDKFSYNPITKEIHHETGDGSGEITKAYAIVYRKGKAPHIELVDFKEYFTALSGKNGVWKSHPSAMVKKVAEVLALKKCYTITGLYAPEEMGMQEPDHIPAGSVYDIDISDGTKPKPDRKARWKAKADQLSQMAAQANVDGPALREIGMAVVGKDDPTKWSIADMDQIIDYLIDSQESAKEEDSEDGNAHAEQTAVDLPSEDDLPWS